MSHVYFPVRSNGSWFISDSTRDELERRIKHCMVLYDTLIFENSRFKLQVWENGHLGWEIPGENYQGDRSTIRYYSPGDEMSFIVSSSKEGEYHPLLEGPVLAAYEIDFYPVLHDANLLEADFVKFLQSGLTEEGKQEVRKRTSKDLKYYTFDKQATGEYYKHKALVEGVHHDSLMAFGIDSPFLADELAGDFISARNEHGGDQVWRNELNANVLNTLYEVAFPDFSSMEWEQIIPIRESAAGQDFRQMIERLTNRLSSAVGDISGPHEISLLSRGLFIEELVAELQELAPDMTTAVLGLGANLIPYTGWASSSAEIVSAFEHRRSWISLLKK